MNHNVSLPHYFVIPMKLEFKSIKTINCNVKGGDLYHIYVLYKNLANIYGFQYPERGPCYELPPPKTNPLLPSIIG